jgi:hypothetical protein
MLFTCDRLLSIVRPHDPPASYAVDFRGMACTCSCIQGPVSRRGWHVSSTGRVTRPPSVRALNLDPAPDRACYGSQLRHTMPPSPHERVEDACTGAPSRREIAAQAHGHWQSASTSHRALAQARQASPLVMMPRMDLRLRVIPNRQLMTIPELLNLSVPHRPCGSAGGTDGLAGLPRIGWDWLRR